MADQALSWDDPDDDDMAGPEGLLDDEDGLEPPEPPEPDDDDRAPGLSMAPAVAVAAAVAGAGVAAAAVRGASRPSTAEAPVAPQVSMPVAEVASKQARRESSIIGDQPTERAESFEGLKPKRPRTLGRRLAEKSHLILVGIVVLGGLAYAVFEIVLPRFFPEAPPQPIVAVRPGPTAARQMPGQSTATPPTVAPLAGLASGPQLRQVDISDTDSAERPAAPLPSQTSQALAGLAGSPAAPAPVAAIDIPKAVVPPTPVPAPRQSIAPVAVAVPRQDISSAGRLGSPAAPPTAGISDADFANEIFAGSVMPAAPVDVASIRFVRLWVGSVPARSPRDADAERKQWSILQQKVAPLLDGAQAILVPAPDGAGGQPFLRILAGPYPSDRGERLCATMVQRSYRCFVAEDSEATLRERNKAQATNERLAAEARLTQISAEVSQLEEERRKLRGLTGQPKEAPRPEAKNEAPKQKRVPADVPRAASTPSPEPVADGGVGGWAVMGAAPSTGATPGVAWLVPQSSPGAVPIEVKVNDQVKGLGRVIDIRKEGRDFVVVTEKGKLITPRQPSF